jgi:hypothetical protein
MSDPFAQGIRSRFSGYDDISDDELLSRFANAAKTDPAKFSSAMRTAFSGYDDTPDAEVAQKFLSKYAAPTPIAPQPQASEQPQTVFDAMRQTASGQIPIAKPAPAQAPQQGFSGGLPDEAYSVGRGSSATPSGVPLKQGYVDAAIKRLEAEKPRPAGLWPGEERGLPGKAWDFITDLSGAGPAAQTAKAQIQLEAQKASEVAMSDAYAKARAEGLPDEKAQAEAKKAYLTPGQYADSILPAGSGMRELQSLIPSATRGFTGSGADLASITGVVLGSQTMKNFAQKLAIVNDEMEPMSNTFLTKLSGAGGSMAFFWLPGIGIARGAEQLALLSAKGAEYLGIGANTVLEAGTEAGGVYNQVLNETGDTKKAATAAAKTFALNAMVIPVTDKLGGLFSRTKGMRATATAAGTESVQEGTQQIISDVSQGKPVDWEATKESALIGGVAGGLTKYVGGKVADAAEERIMKSILERRAKTDAELKEATPYDKIVQKDIEASVKADQTSAIADDEARERAAEAAGFEVGPKSELVEKGTGPKELPVEQAQSDLVGEANKMVEPVAERPVETEKTMEPAPQPSPIAEGKAAQEVTGKPQKISVEAYHGTSKEFSEFNIDKEGNDLVPDRFIGTHFAKDESVAKTFAKGEKGSVKKVQLDITPYKLPQSEKGSDQWAFQVDIARKVFPNRKDLFVKYWSKDRDMTEAEVGQVYDDIKAGKRITSGRLQPRDGSTDQFAGIADNSGMLMFDPILRKEFITEYRKQLSKEGYDSIEYRNTSSEETAQAKDKTAYVVFDKTKIKQEATNGLQKQGKDEGQETQIKGSFMGAGEAVEAIAKTATSIKSKLTDKADTYEDYGESAPAARRVAQQVSQEPVKENKVDFDKFQQQMIDDLYPLKRFGEWAKEKAQNIADTIYGLARLSRGWEGKLQHVLKKGTFDFKTGEINGKGLKEILEPIGKNKKNVRRFDNYLASKHALEMAGQGMKTGITVKDAKATLAVMDRKHPHFKDAAKEVYDFQERMLDYAVDAQLVSKKNRDAWRKKFPHYVPFFRVMETLQDKGFMGKSFTNTGKPFKKLKGSERQIVSPIEGIIKNAAVITSLADRNKVGLKFVELLSNSPEAQLIARPLSDPQQRALSDFFSEQEIESLGMSDSMLKEAVSMMSPAFQEKEGIVSVLVNGKQKMFKVDDIDLYRSMRALNAEHANFIVKALRAPARALRAGATLSPEFMARNPFRDQFIAFIYSKNGFRPFIDGGLGLANRLGQTDLYWEWLRSGAAHAAYVSLDRQYTSEIKKELYRETRDFNPITMMRQASEFFEEATRIGDYRLARRAGKSIALSAFESREVSQDFSMLGEKIRVWNQIAAFSGAQIGGIEKLRRELTGPDRYGVMARIAIMQSLTAGLWFFNKSFPEYRKMEEYIKNGSWLFPIPQADGTIKWKRMPKPFEIGTLFYSGIERFLDYVYEKDPGAARRMAKEWFKQTASSFIPSLAPTAAIPLVEVWTDYSFFRGRRIEGQQYSQLDPEYRYTQFTPNAYRLAGKLTGLSPLKIETLIQGYFGGLGADAARLPDVFFEKKRETTAADLMLLRAFAVRNPTGFRNRDSARFYEEYSELTERHNTLNMLERSGKDAEADAYFDKHEKELEKYEEYKDVSDSLAELRAEQYSVYEDDELPLSEKTSQTAEIDKEIDDLLSDFYSEQH